MADAAVGSVWTVSGVSGQVVVTVGPFGSPDRPECIVTPILDGSEPEFARSRLDVQLNQGEGPFETEVFAAVWNARPALGADLLLNIGTVSTKAIEAVRDVYWSTLAGQPLASDRRLGRFQFFRRHRIIRFQERELTRWQPLSARVWRTRPS
jgi:hypothetical protein